MTGVPIGTVMSRLARARRLLLAALKYDWNHPKPRSPADKHLLLQAAVDGELDAAGMLAFERSLNEDEELAAEYRRLLALREAFRGSAFRNLAKVPASAALRARVERLPQRMSRRRAACRCRAAGARWRSPPVWPFCSAAASPRSCCHTRRPNSTQTLVASHVRGVISGQ